MFYDVCGVSVLSRPLDARWRAVVIIWLLHAWRFHVVIFEEPAGERQNLAVRWMTNGFYTSYFGFEPGGAAVDMAYQGKFFVGRADYEDRSCIVQRVCNVLEEIRILRGVAAADGVRLMMNMANWFSGPDHDLIGFRAIEKEDAGLVVVDPDDRVEMMLRHCDLRANGLGPA